MEPLETPVLRGPQGREVTQDLLDLMETRAHQGTKVLLEPQESLEIKGTVVPME